MMTVPQKLIAVGISVGMVLVAFVFSPILGILALFGTMPFLFSVLSR